MGPALGLGLCLALVATGAWGAPSDEEETAAGETGEEEAEDSEGDAEPAAKKDDEPKDDAKSAGVEPSDDPYDPSEDPEQGYKFIGIRFRDIIVPKFIINLFADGGATVNAFTFGPEFVYRRDSLEFDLALSYADYSMDPFLFKGHDDGIRAMERVWSDMKLIYATVDVMYEWPIDDGRFGFALGGGVGLGIVVDHLYRHQVYPLDPNNPDPDDPNAWGDCQGVGNPGTQGPDGQPYCDDDNSHYPNSDGSPHVEPSWANGGSKPFIFPWISLPALSFRYKPVKFLQTRLDAGFSITGFYLGLAAHYGL
ncbi:MAG: hypothetical protein JRI55_02625 [Deltaproteobacteria bacterium]|nr:hypothetical protein [Deltaproteobacteria bacterium]